MLCYTVLRNVGKETPAVGWGQGTRAARGDGGLGTRAQIIGVHYASSIEHIVHPCSCALFHRRLRGDAAASQPAAEECDGAWPGVLGRGSRWEVRAQFPL